MKDMERSDGASLAQSCRLKHEYECFISYHQTPENRWMARFMRNRLAAAMDVDEDRIFLDLVNLDRLPRLLNQQLLAKSVIVLLTKDTLTRPVVIAELCHANVHKIPLVLVKVEYSGFDFDAAKVALANASFVHNMLESDPAVKTMFEANGIDVGMAGDFLIQGWTQNILMQINARSNDRGLDESIAAIAGRCRTASAAINVTDAQHFLQVLASIEDKEQAIRVHWYLTKLADFSPNEIVIKRAEVGIWNACSNVLAVFGGENHLSALMMNVADRFTKRSKLARRKSKAFSEEELGVPDQPVGIFESPISDATSMKPAFLRSVRSPRSSDGSFQPKSRPSVTMGGSVPSSDVEHEVIMLGQRSDQGGDLASPKASLQRSSSLRSELRVEDPQLLGAEDVDDAMKRCAPELIGALNKWHSDSTISIPCIKLMIKVAAYSGPTRSALGEHSALSVALINYINSHGIDDNLRELLGLFKSKAIRTNLEAVFKLFS